MKATLTLFALSIAALVESTMGPEDTRFAAITFDDPNCSIVVTSD